MHALTDVIDNIDFPHHTAQGRPAATLENVEALVEAFGAVIARPRLNSEQPVPFFPGRPNAQVPELVRDVQIARLRDVCVRHDMPISATTLARYLRLLCIEREENARIGENEKLLSLVEEGAVEDPQMPGAA